VIKASVKEDSLRPKRCLPELLQIKKGIHPMKRIPLETLADKEKYPDYQGQYRHILELLSSGQIRPVKASGKNGKTPSLYREYWLVEGKKAEDEKALEDELTYGMVPGISIDYYRSHMESYRRERKWVLQLNDYLKTGREKLSCPESINERSFEIWGREKFLAKEQGKKVLSHCGLDLEFLNLYPTAEPLAYYSHTRETPQNLLILENKDTFFSMRRHLLEGGEKILGVKIGTLIYGGGKRIIRSFQDFSLCIEPYMRDAGNKIYYFGDLDYEGIGIYENFAQLFHGRWEIQPFLPAYLMMFRKAGRAGELPKTKEKQNRNISGSFFSYFSEEQNRKMKEILEKEEYIPQEILNISDFCQKG